MSEVDNEPVSIAIPFGHSLLEFKMAIDGFSDWVEYRVSLKEEVLTWCKEQGLTISAPMLFIQGNSREILFDTESNIFGVKAYRATFRKQSHAMVFRLNYQV